MGFELCRSPRRGVLLSLRSMAAVFMTAMRTGRKRIRMMERDVSVFSLSFDMKFIDKYHLCLRLCL